MTTTYDGDAIERGPLPEGSEGRGSEVSPRAARPTATSGQRPSRSRRKARRGMALGATEAYCTGCGKPRLIVGVSTADGPQRTVDERYVLVQCGAVKRPGLFDQRKAREIIRARRKRAKAAKAARQLTYGDDPLRAQKMKRVKVPR